MMTNKFKYLLAILFACFCILASTSQERPEIKILDFKEVSNFHIDYAKEFAYQESNRDSTIWALLIVETNDPNIRVISSESNPGHYLWTELRAKPRFDINEHRMPNEIWYSMREGAQKFRVVHSLYRHDSDIPQLMNSKGKHIGRIKDNWYIPVAKMLGEFGLVEAGKTYRLIIDVPLSYQPSKEEKKQDMGWIVIDSKPQGAKVFSIKNGVETLLDKPTPYQERVPYGTYFYRISKNLYHDEEISINLNSEKVDTTVTLRPNFGSINITTTPPGAEVSLSYPLTQTYTTPCRIDNIPSGTYTLTLMKASHTPYEQTITVVGGEVTQVNASLDSKLAQITINSLPGATISINGEAKGITSYTGQLMAGIYDIEATLAGHEKTTKQISVAAKTPQTIELNPTPIYGSLSIMSTPYNATVTVDGEVVGTTPLTLDKLLVGTHTVKINLEGHEEISKVIEIKKGTDDLIDVKLNKAIPHHIAKALKPKWAPNTTDEQKRIITEILNTMVYVEGGTFWMGAQSTDPNGKNYDPEADPLESPVHQVTLSDYFIGKYEITTEQFESIAWGGFHFYPLEERKMPMDSLTWVDCQRFVMKLNHLTGLKFTIPTEAQWEFAARGGNKSKGYKYSGSNNFNEVGWCDTIIHPGGLKKPNELGIYDMTGNMWEWCADYANVYTPNSQTNPRGSFIYLPDLESNIYKTLRGGWSYEEDYQHMNRLSYRMPFNPDEKEIVIGLRIALDIEDPATQNKSEIKYLPNGLKPRWAKNVTAKQKQIIGKLIEDMVWVEGGVFCFSEDDPLSIYDYCIGKYEVTQEQWEAVMGYNCSQNRGLQNPIENISYEEIQNFINKLYNLTKLKFTIPSNGQWEYAARGGKYDKGYTFSGSDYLENVGWYEENSNNTTHPVGQKMPNDLGLYDMSGNVSEFCQTYTINDTTYYPRRGGAYNDFKYRADNLCLMMGTNKEIRYGNIGFRLAYLDGANKIGGKEVESVKTTQQFTITKAEFANTDKENKIINDYGTTLYSNDMRFLNCKITYSGVINEETKKFHIKIINPDGTLAKGTSSPDGYTRTRDIKLYPGDNRIAYIGGWGNSTESSYKPGTYTYEIWLDGKKIYTAHPYIYSGNNPQNKSEFKITGAEFANTDYDGNILNNYGSTLYANDMRYLSCRINYQGSSSNISKSIYVKIYDPKGSIKSGASSPKGYTYKRDVSLKAGNNSIWAGSWGNKNQSTYTAGTYRYEIWIDEQKVYTTYCEIKSSQTTDKSEITKVWADYDVYEYGEKGMMIHINCSVQYAKDHECEFVAYFYDENKNGLIDFDNSYHTSDGKVATNIKRTPFYDKTTYTDLKIFMPYKQLHVNTNGTKKTYYYRIIIHDNKTKEAIATSGYYSFTFSN